MNFEEEDYSVKVYHAVINGRSDYVAVHYESDIPSNNYQYLTTLNAISHRDLRRITDIIETSRALPENFEASIESFLE